jgi:hypothetical protein
MSLQIIILPRDKKKRNIPGIFIMPGNFHNHVLYLLAQRIIDLLTEKLCYSNLHFIRQIIDNKLDAYLQKIQEETKILDEEEENVQKKRKR